MNKEGSTQAPIRHPVDFKHPDFLDSKKLDDEIKDILKDAKKGKLNYSKLFKLIQCLNLESERHCVLSPKNIIEKCELNFETKEYFQSLLEIFEHSAFGIHGSKKQFKYEKKCFKELERIILETK